MTVRLGTKLIANTSSGGTGGTNVLVDNITITKDENDIITTVAIDNKNNSSNIPAVKTWMGTLAEYEAIENKNNDVIYYITDDETLAQSANISLSNLSEEGEKHFLNKSQITNCLLEVPQKIKLELNDGVLTLKAGSKVIVPNGVNKFDEVVINSDISTSYRFSSSQDKLFVFLKTDNNTIFYQSEAALCSGATDTITNKDHFWYDTTNNLFKRINTANEDTGQRFCLPFAICTANATDKWTEIKQVFNGFGYIGSTLFCDKGIKVLISNGKNADGTLKNIEYTTPKVITGTLDVARNNTYFCLRTNGTLAIHSNLKYNENSNYNYVDGVGIIYGVPFAIGTTTTNGVITKYKSLANAVYLADANKTVSKFGDTMTGTLTSEANNGAEIHIKGNDTNNWLTIKGTSSEYDYNDYANIPMKTIRNLRLISYDKNNTYYFYQQVSVDQVENACSFNIKRKLTNGTEKSCILKLRVLETGDNTLLINAKPLKAFIVETYQNGTSWYRVWSDGWIEQGGILANSGSATGQSTIALLKPFKDTNYSVQVSWTNPGTGSPATAWTGCLRSKTTSNFVINKDEVSWISQYTWEAKGY